MSMRELVKVVLAIVALIYTVYAAIAIMVPHK
jgi:hypothetical protein